MERRRALAIAGSLTVTALAGAISAGASTGLFGIGSVGAAAPQAIAQPEPTQPPRIVEVTVPAPTVTSRHASDSPGTPRAGVTAAAPVESTAPAPVVVPTESAPAPPPIAHATDVSPSPAPTHVDDRNESESTEHSGVPSAREDDD